jgi:hypothetical protein
LQDDTERDQEQSKAPISRIAIECAANNNPANEKTNSPEYEIANWTRVVGKWTRGLVFVGILTVVVLVLQLCVLKQNDETVRAGQRAFVFFQKLDVHQIQTTPNGSQWYFILIWENNGSTQTKDLTIKLACERPFDFSKIKPWVLVLGPKQGGGAGACASDSERLEQIHTSKDALHVAGVAVYKDIFGEPHVSKFCRDITIHNDPRPIGISIQSTAGLCADLPDCADKECKNEN